MADNFFDLVNESFFSPFVSKNKKSNYDLLHLINSRMSLDNLLVSKEDIVNWITDYLEKCPIKLFNDETDADSDEGDTRSFAYEKIRYFVKCGWLIEDIDGVKITYQMDENGIKLLSAMENAVKDDTKSLEFSGYVYNIYNNLYNFNSEHAVEITEQVYAASQQLDSMLRGLNVNIKKFLTKLISENEARPKEILETILFDYQKKVVLKAFKNFREKDNPSKYKNYIENKIEDLLNESNLKKMTDNYLRYKCDNLATPENTDEAEKFFQSRLMYIRDQFDEIESYIGMLDKRNTKYITTAQSRLNFLLNEETDIEGRIINCLKGIADADDTVFEDSCFYLYQGANIDKDSLYKPVNKKAKPKAELIEESENDDPEEIERLKENLFRDNEYSVNKINEYVLGLLGENNQMHAKDVTVNELKDLLKVFLIQLYSQNTSIDYSVRYLDEECTMLDYKTNDFIIERKR